MTPVNVRRFSAILGTLVLTWAVAAQGQEYDEDITKTGVFEDDLFVSGNDVAVRADVRGAVVAMADDLIVQSTVSGDVIAMGGDVDLDSDIAGELFAMAGNLKTRGSTLGGMSLFGGNVVSSGDVSGPVLIAGGRIRMNGMARGPVKLLGGTIRQAANIEGDFLAAGGKVDFAKSSAILGKAWVTGGKVDVDGVIVGDLRVAAHKVEISGRIEGDVYIDAAEVEIDDSAVITGNLKYRSHEQADIDSNAAIAGDVTFVRSEMPRKVAGMAFAAAGLAALTAVGGLLILGAVLLWVSPRLFAAATRSVGEACWSSLGIGFAALVVGPVLAVVLISTVIGIPVAIFLVAVYVIALLAGILTAAAALGGRILKAFGRAAAESYWRRLGDLSLGLVILAAIGLIPILGAVMLLLAFAFGTGAMMVNLRRLCAKPAA